MRTNEYTIASSNEITLSKSVRVLGKVLGATASKGAGIVSGATKAVASEVLMSEQGSYMDSCLSYSNKTHYRGSEQASFNYVKEVFSDEKSPSKATEGSSTSL